MATIESLVELNTLNDCAMGSTKQSRWKETTQRYIANMLINNVELRSELLEDRYIVKPTIDFTINERGHVRKIEAPVVRDRVVHKSLCKHVLIPRIRRLLVYDNCASIKDRGTSFARKRFEIMIRRHIRNNGTEGYILLIDIKKYFESIDHSVLKELLKPHIEEEDEKVKQLIHYVIDTSSHTGKGLNLGSEAPQILAVFYLSPVDNYIKILRGVRLFVRYMDDIAIIAKTKEELISILDGIKEQLSLLRLEVNTKKTHIIKLTHGFTFLQIKYDILPSGKILKRPTHKKIVRERRRLKAFKRMYDLGKMTEVDAWNCYQSWRGSVAKDHNACYQTLCSMDALYNRLFPVHEEVRKIGRKELADKIMSDASTSDLYLGLNQLSASPHYHD